jgi:hypothetical protein
MVGTLQMVSCVFLGFQVSVSRPERKYEQPSSHREHHQNHLNTFPHFMAKVKDDDGTELDIHFMALFSQKPDAIPIAFFHGWPG